MGHSIKITPAHLRYEARYQSGDAGQASTEDHESPMQDFETCRLLAIELKERLGRDFGAFWANVPAGCSTRQDIALVAKMLELLDEYGCFDKAIGPLKDYAREIIK
jgi:hypothetical protein